MTVQAEAPRAVPPPIRADGEPLSAEAQRYWERYWQSAVARAVDLNSDLFHLVQWARDVDEILAATQDFQRVGRLTRGSKDQIRLNPLHKYIQDVLSRIAWAEERYGMTPLSRGRLGLASGVPLDALNALRQALDGGTERPTPEAIPPEVHLGDGDR